MGQRAASAGSLNRWRATSTLGLLLAIVGLALVCTQSAATAGRTPGHQPRSGGQASSARTAVRVALEEISPFLPPGADAGWSVEVQHAAVCRLTFSGPHKLRSGPFTIKAAQRYILVSWKLPRKVAPGVWKGKLSCAAKAVRKRSRAVGALAGDFQVSGTGHGRGAQS